MEISKESLLREAEELEFAPLILEKVWHLMSILEEISIHPFLKDRLVLKGGTALNLFIFDLPRLSVDIDLNYIGAQDREAMVKERPQVEKALEVIFQRKGLRIRRIPDRHAGGKWRLQYKSILPQQGTLEVDLNFMFRIPLWNVQKLASKPVGSYQIRGIPVLDVHELAAGKLSALFARRAARDLFDTHYLLANTPLDSSRLRLAFVLYVGMSSTDWQTISPDLLSFDGQEFHAQLFPVSPKKILLQYKDPQKWASEMIEECKKTLPLLIPFAENEKEFLRILSEKGEIQASLLTTDPMMQTKIEKHPLLNWRALLKKGKKPSLLKNS